jgi:hypothetical protein
MQVNRLNYRLLRETVGELRPRGIESWQVALTVPMGRSADRPDWIIDPWSVVEVIDTLAAIQREPWRRSTQTRPRGAVCRSTSPSRTTSGTSARTS